MKRSLLRSISRTLIGVLLFAQLAVAAYACPELAPAGSQSVQTAAAQSPDRVSSDAATTQVDRGIPCDDMTGAADPTFANLCAEHCRHGQQSDQTATLSVPAALLSALYVMPLAPEPARRRVADATVAPAAAPQPHSILHCCLRV